MLELLVFGSARDWAHIARRLRDASVLCMGHKLHRALVSWAVITQFQRSPKSRAKKLKIQEALSADSSTSLSDSHSVGKG